MKLIHLASPKRSVLLTVLGWACISILFAVGALRASDGPRSPVLSALFPWGITLVSMLLWGCSIVSSLKDLIFIKPRATRGWWLALLCLLLSLAPFAVFVFALVLFITWPR